MERTRGARSIESIRYERSDGGRVIVTVVAALISVGSLAIGLAGNESRPADTRDTPAQRTGILPRASAVEAKTGYKDPIRPITAGTGRSYEAPSSNAEEVMAEAPADPMPEHIETDVLPAGSVQTYFRSCADVRAAGRAPILRGQDGYRSGLDRDGDGRACEPKRSY